MRRDRLIIRRGVADQCIPFDVVVVLPRCLLRFGQLHRYRHDHVAQSSGDGSCRLVTVRASREFDDPGHAITPKIFVRGKCIAIRKITQTTGQLDGTLDCQRGALSRTRRGNMGRIADQHRTATAPYRCGRHDLQCADDDQVCWMGMCEQYSRWCTVRREGVPKNVQPPFWQDAAGLNAGQWLMVRQVANQSVRPSSVTL